MNLWAVKIVIEDAAGVSNAVLDGVGGDGHPLVRGAGVGGVRERGLRPLTPLMAISRALVKRAAVAAAAGVSGAVLDGIGGDGHLLVRGAGVDGDGDCRHDDDQDGGGGGGGGGGGELVDHLV